MADELKPCYCGGTPSRCSLNDWQYWIECSDCANETARKATHAEAEEEWDRRAAPIAAQLDAELPPPRNKAGDFEDWAGVYADHEVRNIVAPYAERIAMHERVHNIMVEQVREGAEHIRHLEREHGLLSMVVEQLKARLASADALIESMATEADRRAYIDGRTAGTAPEKFGCHCDLEPHMEPDSCVIDTNRREDCLYARGHATKEACEYWQPIKFAAAPTPTNGGREEAN
jgi:hypothetical protein